MADVRGWIWLITCGAVLAAVAGCSESPPAEVAPAPSPNQTKAVAKPGAPSSTPAASPAREVTELTGFISPSGNVGCMIDSDFVRCDIIDRQWSPPPRPADCEFDYGQGISLARGEGPEFVCAGDTAFGADEELAYGDAIRAGALRCESAEAGVTCRDDGSERGFFVSRESYQLF